MSEKPPILRAEMSELMQTERAYFTRSEIIRFLRRSGSQGPVKLEELSDEKLLDLLTGLQIEDDEQSHKRAELTQGFGEYLAEKTKSRQLEVSRTESFTGDPYSVLGVSQETSFGDIRKAYHRLVRALHDDTFNPRSREHQDLVLLRSPEIVLAALRGKVDILNQESVEEFLQSNTLYPWNLTDRDLPLSPDDLSRFALGQMQVIDNETSASWLSVEQLNLIHYWHFLKPQEGKGSEEQESDSEEKTSREVAKTMAGVFVTKDPLEEFDFGYQTDEVQKQLLEVLGDENCVKRIHEHFKDDEFRSAVQEKVKHEAHRQLLLVREAWDKIKAEQEASGIDRSLEGFDWEDREEILDTQKYFGIHDKTRKKVEALVSWGMDKLNEYREGLPDDDAWEAELECIINDDELFHQYVPSSVDPSEFGVKRFPYKEITLENGGHIRLQMPFYYSSGRKVVYLKDKPESYIGFDYGKSQHYESYGEHHMRKHVDVKHLVIQAYKQIGRELPPSFFRDIADEFMLRDEQLLELAKGVSEEVKVDDVISKLGIAVPKYEGWGDEKKLLNEDEFRKSNRTIEEQIEEYEKLHAALEIFYEDEILYQVEDGYSKVGGVELHVENDGRWRLEFLSYESSNSGEPSFDSYTLTSEEVQLLLRMIGGPTLK